MGDKWETKISGCKNIVIERQGSESKHEFSYVGLGISGGEVFIDTKECHELGRQLMYFAKHQEILGDGETEQVPDEDTIEVRIAVVAWRDSLGNPRYAARGLSEVTNEATEIDELLEEACMEELYEVGQAAVVYVTTRMSVPPLPPKPVVHEVEGEVEGDRYVGPVYDIGYDPSAKTATLKETDDTKEPTND